MYDCFKTYCIIAYDCLKTVCTTFVQAVALPVLHVTIQQLV